MTVKELRSLEAKRRNGIKRIEARIAKGEVKTPQKECLHQIKGRLISYYELRFGPYTGKPKYK